ncbi:hypothetical protein DVH24_039612 [Malus domestica]|uniref:Uncharacterized protein n=1 Tax=Malus domestica TaxID=3750 RepID=A0A498I805_MALDO|nr:hypothetical protein DVH24_039612 [Malus domestica]
MTSRKTALAVEKRSKMLAAKLMSQVFKVYTESDTAKAYAGAGHVMWACRHPTSNGVIPQSPMHTKSLATLKHQLLRNKLASTARSSIRKNQV